MGKKTDSAFTALLSAIFLGLAWYFQTVHGLWDALLFLLIGIACGYAAYRTYKEKTSATASFIMRHRRDMEKLNRPFAIFLTTLSVSAIALVYVLVPVLREVMGSIGNGGIFFHLIISTYKFSFIVAVVAIILVILYFRTPNEQIDKSAKIFLYIQITSGLTALMIFLTIAVMTLNVTVK